jgi:hypothetical protein
MHARMHEVEYASTPIATHPAMRDQDDHNEASEHAARAPQSPTQPNERPRRYDAKKNEVDADNPMICRSID